MANRDARWYVSKAEDEAARAARTLVEVQTMASFPAIRKEWNAKYMDSALAHLQKAQQALERAIALEKQEVGN